MKSGISSSSPEDIDDLLDLLSDSGDEDQTPKKREKPLIPLTSKLKPDAPTTSTPTPPTLTNGEDPAIQDNGKPITSTATKSTINENDEIERPRTSRGKQDLVDTKGSSDYVSAPGKESKKSSSGANVLTLDSSSKQSAPAGSLKSAQVEFDDDEGDDLLSGMGLDDSDVIGLAKQPGKGKPERRGSVLDELLGKKSSAASKEAQYNRSKTTATKAKKLGEDDSTKDSDGEGESFQFGGYVPSAASGDSSSNSGQAKKPRLKVPTGRRGFSELSLPPDALTARPGSAPSPAVKKSVRFSDTVETSDRPLSSPAATNEGGVTNPISDSHSNRRTATSSDKEEALSASKQNSEGAKKPPLPRSSGKSKESGEQLETDLDVKGEDKMVQDGDGGAKEGDVPLQGRGRRTSLTKPPPSSTNSLFEESPQTTDSADIGLSNDGPLTQEEGVAKTLKSEEGKLERPVFPWQKGRQTRSQSLGSINAPGSPSRQLPEKRSARDHMTSHDPLKGPKAADHVTTASHDTVKGPTVGNHMTSSHDPILDQSSQLASFQEMLLQQQKQMQEQFKESLQAQLGGVTPTIMTGSSKLSSVEEERLRGELRSSQELVKELETQLKAAKSKHSETQVSLVLTDYRYEQMLHEKATVAYHKLITSCSVYFAQ